MLLLLVVPFVEIYVFVQVATWIGVLDAMGLLLLISLIGVCIVWKQGASAWRRIRNELATGQGARAPRSSTAASSSSPGCC